nr:ribosomal biogenesis protein LAS1L-like isoform X2 [Ipomoea batatas]
MLGFKESYLNDVEDQKSQGLKLVPWLTWEEWSFIGDSLFSSSPLSVDSALRRISTWRNRGCIPVAVDVTASIIEIQQKDPYFRDGVPKSVQLSEEMLAMLYSMAITRLVNGVIEKNRKKNELSIAEAAYAIGIPRMLIDVRHEGSHRDLPSLQLVRLASTKALRWLQSYYWEPQKSAIQSSQPTKLQKETSDRLNELAFYLKEIITVVV